VAQARFAAVLKAVAPFWVETGDLARLGQRGQTARLIKDTPPLCELHRLCLATVQTNGWPLSGRYTGRHFKPHITLKFGQSLPDRLYIDHVYLLEKLPQGYRRTIAKIGLMGG
jgi:hypothetical protein